MLKAGIVGLPNVGKSTLFNALTRSHKAAAENYPFCTIEPNLGVVTVPDPRLEPLGKIVKVSRFIPTTIEFLDIAGNAVAAGSPRVDWARPRFQLLPAPAAPAAALPHPYALHNWYPLHINFH